MNRPFVRSEVNKLKKDRQPKTTERIGAPVVKEVNGKAVLFCAFCKPTHPIIPGEVSRCGSAIQIRQVQIIYKAQNDPSLKCAKCHAGGGEMVMIGDALFHTHDCVPGVVVMTDPPKFSKFAKFVSGLNPTLRDYVEKFTGQVQSVDEVLTDGTQTGVVLGWFFKDKPNGKHTAVST